MTSAYLTVDDAPSDDIPDKSEVSAENDIPEVFFCERRR
jgi:hypothetical protein